MCDNRFDYIVAGGGYFEGQFKEVADQYMISTESRVSSFQSYRNVVGNWGSFV